MESSDGGRHLDGLLSGAEPFRSPLLRLLVDPIKVTYHRDLRCLMRYEGLSNLQDPNGDNYSVRIDFPLSERSDWVVDNAPAKRAANDD